ncbi:hypothetical protein MGN70_014001 [Eutypa lata]|nr:hypothetical protein MGN70_014001 [Eutypa lata]
MVRSRSLWAISAFTFAALVGAQDYSYPSLNLTQDACSDYPTGYPTEVTVTETEIETETETKTKTETETETETEIKTKTETETETDTETETCTVTVPTTLFETVTVFTISTKNYTQSVSITVTDEDTVTKETTTTDYTTDYTTTTTTELYTKSYVTTTTVCYGDTPTSSSTIDDTTTTTTTWTTTTITSCPWDCEGTVAALAHGDVTCVVSTRWETTTETSFITTTQPITTTTTATATATETETATQTQSFTTTQPTTITTTQPTTTTATTTYTTLVPTVTTTTLIQTTLVPTTVISESTLVTTEYSTSTYTTVSSFTTSVLQTITDTVTGTTTTTDTATITDTFVTVSVSVSISATTDTATATDTITDTTTTELPGTVTTLPGSTQTSLITITQPGTTIVTPTTLPGSTETSLVTITQPGATIITPTTIIVPPVTVTTTVITASSVCAAPSNAPGVPVRQFDPRSDLTWGCKPGTVCSPIKPAGCEVWAAPPDDSYVCDQTRCIESPDFEPVNWSENSTYYYPPTEGYFNLPPGAFGLSYDIFDVEVYVTEVEGGYGHPLTTTISTGNWESQSTITEYPPPSTTTAGYPVTTYGVAARKRSVVLSKRDDTIPSQCFDTCNNAYIEAESVGKSPELCKDGSVFKSDYEDCNACIDANNDSVPIGGRTYPLPQFAHDFSHGSSNHTIYVQFQFQLQLPFHHLNSYLLSDSLSHNVLRYDLFGGYYFIIRDNHFFRYDYYFFNCFSRVDYFFSVDYFFFSVNYLLRDYFFLTDYIFFRINYRRLYNQCKFEPYVDHHDHIDGWVGKQHCLVNDDNDNNFDFNINLLDRNPHYLEYFHCALADTNSGCGGINTSGPWVQI